MKFIRRIGVPLILVASIYSAGFAVQQPAPPPPAEPPTSLAAHIRDWPRAAQLAAEMMTQKYGPPREMTAAVLVWGESGPWKRIIIHREGIPHNFPEPHTDVIEQVINYQVRVDMFDDLAEFDGSLQADRTRGELSVRCDTEATNFAVVNVANEVLSEKRSVQDARHFVALQVSAMRAGKSAPYTKKLMFTPPFNSADPDSPVMR